MSSSDEDVVEEQDEVQSLEEVLSNLNYKAAQTDEQTSEPTSDSNAATAQKVQR